MSILAGLPLVGVSKTSTRIGEVLRFVRLTTAKVNVAVVTLDFPPLKLGGRERLPAGRPVAPLVAVFFGGLGSYFFAISIISAVMNRGQPAATMPATEPVQ